MERWLLSEEPTNAKLLEDHFSAFNDSNRGPTHVGAHGFAQFPNLFTDKIEAIWDTTIGEVAYRVRELKKNQDFAPSINALDEPSSLSPGDFVVLAKDAAPGLVCVDLRRSADELKAAFVKWLREKKPEANATKAKKAINKQELCKWIEWRIVPAVDLDQWARWSKTSLPNLVELLENFGSHSDIKTWKPERIIAKRNEWLSDVTFDRLVRAISRESASISSRPVSLNTGLRSALLSEATANSQTKMKRSFLG